jgi:hypothetical protein
MAEGNPAPNDSDELRELLEYHGFDVSQWGVGATKPIDALWEEVSQGESELIEADGELIRRTHCVGVDVFVELANGSRLKLREDRQVYKNGSVRSRNLISSLAEKTRPDETPAGSVSRAIKEELGIAAVKSMKIGDRLIINKDSETYNGMATQLVIRLAEVELYLTDYQPDGYVEVQTDKSVYFTWLSI